MSEMAILGQLRSWKRGIANILRPSSVEQAAVMLKIYQEGILAIFGQVLSFGKQFFIQLFIELLRGDHQVIHAVFNAILQYPPDVTPNIFCRLAAFQMIG
jgi:hypothetical protein